MSCSKTSTGKRSRLRRFRTSDLHVLELLEVFGKTSCVNTITISPMGMRILVMMSMVLLQRVKTPVEKEKHRTNKNNNLDQHLKSSEPHQNGWLEQTSFRSIHQ